MNPFDDITFNTYDYPIGGKMVVGKLIIDEYQFAMGFSDNETRQLAKLKLTQQLANYILENKLIEFTHINNTDGTKTIAVRAYLAPDDNIKILRTARKLD
jgi:hypothetical protein